MTTDTNEGFRAMVAQSELFKNRFENVVARVTAIAADEFGIAIDREAIVNLPEARICTISDVGLDAAQVARELAALPAVIKAKANKDLKRDIEAGKEAAIASLPRDRAARLSAARVGGFAGGTTPTTPKHTADEEAVLVRRALSLGSAKARLDFCRKHGLGIA